MDQPGAFATLCDKGRAGCRCGAGHADGLKPSLSYVLREPAKPSGGGKGIKQLLGHGLAHALGQAELLGPGSAQPATADRTGEATLYVLSDLVLLVAPDPPVRPSTPTYPYP